MSEKDYTVGHDIICPHCGYKNEDNLEVYDFEDRYFICYGCDKEFYIERHDMILYTIAKEGAKQ